MSTLGKVLVVLIVLSLLGWIFLASLVTQHHMNWAQRLNEVKKEVADLEAELPPIQESIYETTEAASLAQVGLDRSRRNFRNELTRAQKAESDSKEALDRFTLQLATAQASAKAAVDRQDIRRKERLDLEKNIATEQGTVAELKAQNEKLRGELDNLQKAFIQTLAENKAYADRLLKKDPSARSASSTGRPAVRLAH